MAVMSRRLILLSLLLAAGCAEPSGGTTPAAATGPADAVILPASTIPQLLAQCSRSAPDGGQGTWSPAWADVVALEAALPAALTASSIGKDLRNPAPPEGWRRQYVGYVRDGRRIVYGNFYPSTDDVPNWRTDPVIVYDGGPAFFGVEYDAGARRIVRLNFNGPY